MRIQGYLFSVLTVAMAGAAGHALAVPVLANGSLTGPIANNGVPSGWSILANSPDTMDQDNNVGVPGLGDFGAAPSGPSPDGGTWVGIGRDIGFIETFAQSVAGFTIGQQYQLSWYAGNFGFAPAGYVNPNAIEALVGGVSIGAGSTLALDANWVQQSLVFTATATTLQIAFNLETDTQAYMSIDGITLTETGPGPGPGPVVSEPGALAILALALAGLAAVRRTRAM